MSMQENLILAAMEYLAFTLLIFKTAGESVKKYYSVVPAFIAGAVCISALIMLTDLRLASIISFTYFLVFIKLAFERPVIITVIIQLFAYSLLFFIQFLFFGIMNSIGYDIVFSFAIGIRHMSSILLFVVSIYLFAPLNKVTEAAEKRRELIYVFIPASVIILGISIHSATVFRHTTVIHRESLMIQLTIFISIILTSCLIVHFFIIIGDKKKAKMNYSRFEADSAAFRFDYPEYNKYLEAAHCLALMNDDFKTYKHIKEHLNNMQAPDEFKFMHSSVKLTCLKRGAFAAFLYIKILQLKMNGVKCWLNIYDFSLKAKINDHRLIEAVGLLIDRAWETVRSHETEDEQNSRQIMINIVKKDGEAYVEVMNRLDKPMAPEEFFGLFRTKEHATKGLNKLFGSYKMEQILYENDCELRFQHLEYDGKKYASFKLIL